MCISNFSAPLIAAPGMHSQEFRLFIFVYMELCLQPRTKLHKEQCIPPASKKSLVITLGLGCWIDIWASVKNRSWNMYSK